MSTIDHDEPMSLQQQVDLLKEQLAQAQRLTALGELVSTTTHEFNNVLMTIINYAKLGMRHRDNATREKSFEKILAASTRAAKITATVLGLARNRSAGQEPTDLQELVENSLLLLEREMNKYRITVDKSFQPIPEAYVNGNQIQQVLLNLLINARQAMTNGGRVADQTRLRRRERHDRSGGPRQRLRHSARQAAANFRRLLHDEERPRRQRQRRDGPGAFDLPRHHRGPSRPHPRRQHGRQGDGLHPEAAHGGQSHWKILGCWPALDHTAAFGGHLGRTAGLSVTPAENRRLVCRIQRGGLTCREAFSSSFLPEALLQCEAWQLFD